MKIILIREVAAMLRVAPITIRRWLQRARKGENSFPLPIFFNNHLFVVTCSSATPPLIENLYNKKALPIILDNAVLIYLLNSNF